MEISSLYKTLISTSSSLPGLPLISLLRHSPLFLLVPVLLLIHHLYDGLEARHGNPKLINLTQDHTKEGTLNGELVLTDSRLLQVHGQHVHVGTRSHRAPQPHLDTPGQARLVAYLSVKEVEVREEDGGAFLVNQIVLTDMINVHLFIPQSQQDFPPTLLLIHMVLFDAFVVAKLILPPAPGW
eukprot:sb/3471506/